jgi:hypothetical protein
MPIRIRLSKKLYEDAVADGRVKNKSDVEEKSGLTYPTVLALTSGKHAANTYDILAKYFEGLGINGYDLARMTFNEVFEMREIPK